MGSVIALAPLSWLMTVVYAVQWWATALFAVPLYSTRLAYARFIEMREMFTQTIGALAEAVDKRDPFTAKHSQRVKDIAVDIGRVMHVSDGELEALEWGGLLHDVGKIGVPGEVLRKPGPLTSEERERMDQHTAIGARMLERIPFLAPVAPLVRSAHERFDGGGYPDGLRGEQIPRGAMVIATCDAFHAMTSNRSYRQAMAHEEAIVELRANAGTQFDPVVVDALVAELT
jgi:putative nucleotidyltransferase with HDIG domain